MLAKCEYAGFVSLATLFEEAFTRVRRRKNEGRGGRWDWKTSKRTFAAVSLPTLFWGPFLPGPDGDRLALQLQNRGLTEIRLQAPDNTRHRWLYLLFSARFASPLVTLI